MSKLNSDMTVMDVLVTMSEGNPGATTVLIEVMKNAGKIDPQNAMGGLGFVMDLDTLGLYGSAIWVLYKDVCGQNLDVMLCVLRCWQMGFLSEVHLRQAVCAGSDHALNLDDLANQLTHRLPSFNIKPNSSWPAGPTRKATVIVEVITPMADVPVNPIMCRKERKWQAAQKAVQRFILPNPPRTDAKTTRRLSYWFGVMTHNTGPWDPCFGI